MSVDPLVAITGEPYVYGSANPATYSDPAGLCPLGPHGDAAACYFFAAGEAYGDVSPEVVTAASDIAHGLAPRPGARPARASDGYDGADYGFTRDELALLYAARGSYLNPGGNAFSTNSMAHLEPLSQANWWTYVEGGGWHSDRALGAVRGPWLAVEFVTGLLTGRVAMRPTPGLASGTATAPTVSNTRLQNIAKDFYSEGNIYRGTTADAVRYELSSGFRVGTRLHTEKAQNLVNGLNKLIRSGKLNSEDLAVARTILSDLVDALP